MAGLDETLAWIRELLRDWDVLPPADAGRLRVDDPTQAVMVHWLLTNPRRWMLRRVEAFRLIDDRTVERRTSFDFQLPDQVLERDLGSSLRLIPLATFAKRNLTGFDLRDEDDRPLALLGTRDNGTVATAALMALAESVLERRPHALTCHVLERIAREQLREAEQARALVRWPTEVGFRSISTGVLRKVIDGYDGWGPEARIFALFWLTLMWEWRELERSPTAKQLMDELAAEFILLTPAVGDLAARRIIKMRYEETYKEGSDLGVIGWLAVRLGILPTVVNFEAPGTARCLSYHAEVSAPQDAELVALYVDDGNLKWDLEPAPWDDPRGRLHARITEGHFQTAGQVITILRARPAGFLRSALAICALTFALLLGGRLSLDQIVGEVEATATLLLLIPGLLAAYILRPGEHALVTSLLSGVRLIVLLVGAAAVVAASLLVAQVSRPTLEYAWTTLTALVACLA
jgi:hypothetical protein